jgi:heterodisulfide reductase subunit A
MDECIAQAAGTAARSLTIISKENLTSEGIVASVNENYCDGCGICVGCCDYNAIQLMDDGLGGIKSYVNPGLCKGCGCCVSACPAGAMEQKGFKNVQIQAEIDACLDWKVGV